MKKQFVIALFFASTSICFLAHASSEHDHAEAGHEESDSDGDDHENDKPHDESSIASPEKGIMAANAESGIKLSPEALKNFGLQAITLTTPAPWILPTAAVVYSGREVNLYRLRDGFYKRIDFKLLSKESNGVRVSSADLKGGDSVVTAGLGFLRVAEIAAFGGAPEGHSH